MWGLLDETPKVLVEAPLKQVREVTAHVLRAVARANTRDMMVAQGLLGQGRRGKRALD
jgi:hypothetical protein